jgi:hypothetical protein
VSQRYHGDHIITNPLVQRKREMVEKNASRPVLSRWIPHRRLSNPVGRDREFAEKRGGRKHAPRFVPRLRVLDFSRGGVVELNAHSGD